MGYSIAEFYAIAFAFDFVMVYNSLRFARQRVKHIDCPRGRDGCVASPYGRDGSTSRPPEMEGVSVRTCRRVRGVESEKMMCMLDEIRAKRDEIYAIAKKHKAEKLWVFGSCARKEERPDSDVDLLVRFSDGAEFGVQVSLGDDFNAYFGRKVDIVSDRGLSPYIGKFIRKEALPI